MYRKSFRLTNGEIDAAFAGGHFRLAYQPKFALTDGRVMGVEAYARWHHPAFGVIPPALFLPVFARQGRSQELTRFVLREAVDQLAAWNAKARDWRVSVNVAPDELTDGSLAVSLGLILNDSDVPPGRLVVELPEEGLAAAPEQAAATTQALREIGVSLALECASQPMPEIEVLGDAGFGELKIGGSAIIHFAQQLQGTGLGLIERRLAFARAHHMGATAVGAETPETITALKRMGFTAVQGNALAAPADAAALDSLDERKVREALGLIPKIKTGKTAAPAAFQAPRAHDAARKPARIRVVRGPAQISLTAEDGEHGSHSVLRLGTGTSAPARTNGGKPERTNKRRKERTEAPARDEAQDSAPGAFARLGRSLSRALFS